MKLEHLYSFFTHFLISGILFNFFFLINVCNKFILNYFFNWKVSNFADGYWFLYSNKKSIYELRYLNK